MLLPLCSPRGAYAEVLHQLSQRQQNRCQGRERTAPSRSSRRLRTAVIAPVHPQIAALGPAQGRKPRKRSTTENGDEIPPPHAIPYVSFGARKSIALCDWPAEEQRAPTSLRRDVSVGSKKQISWRVCFYVSSLPQKLTHASQQNDVLEFLVLHSSNASAPRIIPRGISSPSALAVLRLTTISSLVGCSTGRSAGFTPFRILST